MAVRSKWQRFEDLAAVIQRELAPDNAVVTQNERVRGVITQTSRQIDIAVRIPTGAGQLFWVVECKDLATKVDVKDVESFIGMLPDVGANKGAMIASAGFTEAAKRRAEAAAVEAWTLVDVESVDWPVRVTVPFLIERHFPVCSFRFQVSSFLSAMGLKELAGVPLFDSPEAAVPIGTPHTLFARWWNSLDVEPTTETLEVPLHPGLAYIKSAQGVSEVKVSAKVRIEPTLFFGEVPIVKMRGLAGPDMKKVRTRSITTDWIRFVEVESTWRKLTSRDEIAVQPTMELHTSAVLDESPAGLEAIALA